MLSIHFLLLCLQELYGLGLRKLAVQNVGPLGCYPTVKAMHPELNGSCAKNFLASAILHNRVLPMRLENMQKRLPGFKFGIFDYYQALGDRIKNPTKYGML